MINRGLFAEEQKCYRKWTRGTGVQLYIDQHIHKESKMRRKNITMAWIIYKKAYDMVPQIWIADHLKMYKISDKVIKFIENTIENWNVEMIAGEKRLTEVKIQRGIFREDVLSPFLFVIVRVPLNHIFRKCSGGYKLTKSQKKINQLMNIKPFAKREKNCTP